MSIKEKTVNGLIWSFIDSFANFGIQFLIGVVLARILSPREFGLIGMLTIFIALSQTFIDSGFSTALIRKKNCTQTDYSTVFFFNLVISLLCYLLLYGFSGAISSFFDEPQLKFLVQVMGIGLILNSFGIIQRAILTKEINFKLQTKISLIASLGSGTIAIAMALKGFGVWSLVALTLCRYALTSVFLWVYTKWQPKLIFCIKSFKVLFGFGSKLLLSSLIDTAFQNIYYLVIGKYFSAVELGFYTRADQFKAMPSQNITTVIQRVSYPILSSMQDDLPQLKEYYRKLIRSTMFITFMLMLGMAAVAKSMIITLIGEKWLPSVVYLQLLCLVGMFYPLHAMNLNILNVQGRSDLFLRLEIIKKSLAVPTIVIGIFWGIKIMIIGMLVNTLIAYFLNSYWSGKMIGYSFTQQVKDILPSFVLAIFVNGIVFSINFLDITAPNLLVLQITIGTLSTFVICELIKFNDYIFIKNIVNQKLFRKK
ncbi:MAG TPA: flippase [Rikenellaceae bacterium]|nr:MAG: lipopolysaccharide biosynthesis protein [Bacteroidetes bacterium GWE2_40_15]HBZ26118.1 flippase [Rikenellaceae bacterium]